MSESDTRYHTSDGSEIARLDEIKSRLGEVDDGPAEFDTAASSDMNRLVPDVRAWLRAKVLAEG